VIVFALAAYVVSVGWAWIDIYALDIWDDKFGDPDDNFRFARVFAGMVAAVATIGHATVRWLLRRRTLKRSLLWSVAAALLVAAVSAMRLAEPIVAALDRILGDITSAAAAFVLVGAAASLLTLPLTAGNRG